MPEENCGCAEKHDGNCRGCAGEQIFSYWCETCRRSVAEKRCPYCGLKAQRKKG